MKQSKIFHDKRYDKYLCKRMREPHTMIQMLDSWFCRYKVTSSSDTPGKGRLDPIKGTSLFTSETKPAVKNCKEKAKHLSDPFPFEEMYDMIQPSPRCKHSLTEYLSKRGESKLESYHDRSVHYANTGMRASLVDSLSLVGMAAHNLRIRHKRSFRLSENREARKHIPSSWKKVLPYHNHSKLQYVNGLATAVGATIPFPGAEELSDDNSERFFSQYMTTKPASVVIDCLGRCTCPLCMSPSAPSCSKPSMDPLVTQTTRASQSPPKQQQQIQEQPQQQMLQTKPPQLLQQNAPRMQITPPAPQQHLPQLIPTLPMYHVVPIKVTIASCSQSCMLR
jgi:hypothetical protein